jgi:N-acetylglucosaminyl-diphospho-decaprenol L-rhamnosyltransferase
MSSGYRARGMAPAADVCVIVPTYEGRHHLESLLPSLRRQTLPHQVIVVDNASTDGTSDFLRQHWPDVQVISNPENIGFGKAANAGVAAAGSRTVVLLNNDTVCTPTFLERLVEALDPRQGVVMAAPVLVRLGNEGRIDTAGIVVDRSLHGFDHLYGEPVEVLTSGAFDPLAPCGGAAAFDRAAFVEVGGFDPAFFAYLEDVDLGIRCVSRGWRCRLAPTAVAVHAHSGTLGEGSPAKNRLTGWGRGYIAGKYRLHRQPRLLFWAVAGEMVMAVGKAVVDRDLSSTKAFVTGLGAGLRAEPEPLPRLPAGPASLSPFDGFRRRLTRRFKIDSGPRHRLAA